MVTMTGIYEGDKHCALTHGPSLSELHTDAPKDNNGRGEAFSPTDLVGAALGSCLMTVMGIYADNNGINLKGSYFSIVKEMQVNPRKIASLTVNLTLPEKLTSKERATLEAIALTCPVKLSLHPDVLMPITFHYKDI